MSLKPIFPLKEYKNSDDLDTNNSEGYENGRSIDEKNSTMERPFLNPIFNRTYEEQKDISFVVSGISITHYSLTRLIGSNDWLKICPTTGKLYGTSPPAIWAPTPYRYKITAYNTTSFISERTFYIFIKKNAGRDFSRIGTGPDTSPCPETPPPTPPDVPFAVWGRPSYSPTTNRVTINIVFRANGTRGPFLRVRNFTRFDLRIRRRNQTSVSRGGWQTVISPSSSTNYYNSYTVTLTPPFNYKGDMAVAIVGDSVVSTDGELGPTDSRTWSSYIHVDNRLPSLESIDSQVIDERTSFSLTPSGTAITHYSLLKVRGSGTWLTICSKTGKLEGTTPQVLRGFTWYTYRITASNARSNLSRNPPTNISQQTFHIFIKNIDRPTIAPISDRSYDEETNIQTFSAGVSPIFSVFTWTLTKLSSGSSRSAGTEDWLTIKNSNASIVVLGGTTPSVSGTSKTYKYRLKAKNQVGEDTEDFTITVNPTDPPTIGTITSPRTVDEIRYISINPNIRDATLVSVSRTGNSNWLRWNSGLARIIGNSPDVSGTIGIDSYTFTVTATNDSGSTSKPFIVNVQNTTHPTVGSITPGIVNERTQITLQPPTNSDVQTWSIRKTSRRGSDWLEIHSCTGVMSGLSLDITRGTFSYDYEITVANNTTTRNTSSFRIGVRNTQPLINPFSDFPINENTAISGKQITGDAITNYSISGPNWLNINIDTGTLSGTSPPVDKGEAEDDFIVTVTGLDGTTATRPFTITVVNTTLPSINTISDQSINEGSQLNITVLTSNDDAVDSWSMSFLTDKSTGTFDWIKFCSTSQTIYGPAPGIPSDNRTYTYELTATNNAGSDSKEFTITVNNVSPKLNDIPSFSVYENTVITSRHNIKASGTNITSYSIAITTAGDRMTTTGDRWLNISNTGIITGNSPGVPKGCVDYTFTVTARNRPHTTEMDTKSFTVTVINTTLPVIDTTTLGTDVNGVPTRTINEGCNLRFTVSAIDNDVVKSWSISFISSQSSSGVSGTWLSFNTNTRRISGEAPSITAGNKTYTYSVTATNNAGSDLERFKIIVQNTTPSLNPIPSFRINENTVITLRHNIRVFGTNITDYSISGPTWLNINSSTGFLTGTSPEVLINTDEDDFTVTATNSPSSTESDTETFTITVINTTKPTIRTITGLTLNEGSPVNFEVNATNNNIVSSWSMSFLSSLSSSGVSGSWLSFNTSTRAVSGTTPSVTGTRKTYTYQITATNNAGSTLRNFSIIVKDTTFIARWGPPSYSKSTNRLSANIAFSHRITGIDKTDFEVLDSSNTVQTGWDFDPPTSSINYANRYITISASAPAITDGSFKLRIKVNSVRFDSSSNNNGPNTATTTSSITVNNIVIATASWSNLSGGITLSGRITFRNTSVTGITNTDFSVLSSNNRIQTGWSISVGTSSLSVNQYTTVTATPPANTNGSFKLQLNATSVRSGGSSRDNSPSNNVRSQPYAINNLPRVTVSSFTAPSGKQRGTISTFRLVLDRLVPANQLSISDFTTDDDTPISSITPSSGNSSSYTINVTNPTNDNGSYNILLKKNAINASTSYRSGPINAITSGIVTYDTRPFTATWGSASYCDTSNKLSALIRFSHNVAGITVTDFRIVNNSNPPVEQGSWTFDTPVSSVNANTDIIISAEAPNDTNGSFALRINANTLRFDRESSNNGPNRIYTSGLVLVNNLSAITVSSFAAPTGKQRGTISAFRLTLDHSIPTNVLSTSDFTPDASTSISSIVSINPITSTASSFTINVINPTNSAGSYRIYLGQNTIPSGTTYNIGPIANVYSTSVDYDTKPFTSTWGTPSYCSTSGKLSATIQFSHNVTNISITDFDIVNESLISQNRWTFDTPASSVNANTNITISAAAPNDTNGFFALRINANTLRFDGETSNNGPIQSTVTSFVLINNLPRVIASFITPTPVQRGSSTIFGLTLDRDIPATVLTISDFGTSFAVDVTNKAIIASISPTSGNGRSYNITVTNPINATGSYTISINANAIPNSSTYKSNLAVTSGGVSYDTRPLTATWGTPSYCSTSDKLSATIRFSLPVTGIEDSDFDIVNGSLVSQNRWTFDTPASSVNANTDITISAEAPDDTNGSFALRINANTLRFGGDSENNGPIQSAVTSFVLINNLPRVIASFITPTPVQRGSSTIFGLTLDRDIPATVLTTSDFGTSFAVDVTNKAIIASISPTSGNGRSYNITVTNPINATGSYTISINANAIPNSSTYKSNLAVTSGGVSYDTRPLIATWGTPSYCSTSDKLSATIRFSLPVTGIEDSDFDIVNGSLVSQNRWTFDTPASSVNANTDITISAEAPDDTNGSFALRINANTVKFGGDSENNGPIQSTITSFVLINNLPRVIANFTTPTAVQRRPSTIFELTLDRDIPATVLTISDFGTSFAVDATNKAIIASISPTSGNARSYNITVTNPINATGSYTISINANAIPNSSTYRGNSAVTSGGVSYDTRPLTATWGTPSYCSTSNKLSATIRFSLAVTGIEDSDFRVIDNTSPNPIEQGSWTFDAPVTNVNANTDITIKAEAPDNTNGSFGLRIKANTVKFGGDSENNGPSLETSTGTISIDNRPQLIVSSFTAPTGIQRRPTSTFLLTLNKEVPTDQLTVSDFIISSSTSSTGITINSVSPNISGSTNENIYKIIVNQPTNSTGKYRITISENTIVGTTTYKPGPIQPLIERQSPEIDYDTTAITATWGSVSTPDTTDRSATSTLTFSRNPGTGFSITVDIRIQKRSGTSPTFAWTTEVETNWGFSVDGSQTITSIPIKATPSPSVDEGTYRFLLVANALGTGTGGQVSTGFTIGEDMAIPSASISGEQFYKETRKVYFTVYWANIGESQILLFDDSIGASKLTVIKSSSITETIPTPTVNNNELSDMTKTNSFEVTLTIPINQKGTVQLQINANAIANSLAVLSQSVPVDTRSKVTFSFGNVFTSEGGTETVDIGTDTDPVAITVSPIYIGISRVGTDNNILTASDFIVSGVCRDTLIPTTATNSWRLKIDIPEGDKGTFTVTLSNDIVVEGNDSISKSFKFDRSTVVTATIPTPTVNNGWFYKDTNTIDFYVTWANATSAQIGSFATVASSKIKVYDANAMSLTELTSITKMGSHLNGNVVKITLTGLGTNANGRLYIKVNEDAIGSSPETQSLPVDYNTTGKVTFTFDRVYTTSTGSSIISPEFTIPNIYVEISSNIAVEDFTSTDIIIEGSCIGSLTKQTGESITDNTVWRLEISIPDDTEGTIVITILENSVSYGNNAVRQSYNFNRLIPSVRITNGTFNKADSNIIFYLYWSNISDTQRTTFITQTEINNNIKVYQAGNRTTEISGITKSAVLEVSNTIKLTIGGLPSNENNYLYIIVSANAIGNSLIAESFPVNYDTRIPITFYILNAYSDDSTMVALNTSTAFTNTSVYVEINSGTTTTNELTASDFIVSGACRGPLTPSGSVHTWRLKVDIPDGDKGTLTVALPSDVVSQGNQPVSKSFKFDRSTSVTSSTPTPTINNGWFNKSIPDITFYINWINVTPAQITTFIGNINGQPGPPIIPATIIVYNATNSEELTSITKSGESLNGNVVRIRLSNLGTDTSGRLYIKVNEDAIGSSPETQSLPVDYNTTGKVTFTFDRVYTTSTGSSIISPEFTIPNIYVEISSNIAVEDFTSTDIIIEGSCIGSLTKQTGESITDNTVWRLEISIPDNTEGRMIITILENSVSLGNNAVRQSYEYNRLIPSVRITNGTFNKADSNIIFYLYWSNISDTQRTTFITQTEINNNIKVYQAGNRTTEISGITKSAVLEVSNTIKLTIGGLPSNENNYLYIIVSANAIGNSLIAESFPVNYDTRIPITFYILNAYSDDSTMVALNTSTAFTNTSVYVEINSGTTTTNELTASDFIVSGACRGPLTPSGSVHTWRLKVDIPAEDKGTLTVALPSDVVSQGNQPISKSFEFDRTTSVTSLTPTPTVNNGWFYKDTNTIDFYITWISATPAQITTFIGNINEQPGPPIIPATITVYNAMNDIELTTITKMGEHLNGNVVRIRLTNLGTSTSGRLYITVNEDAIGSSPQTQSLPVDYNTISLTFQIGSAYSNADLADVNEITGSITGTTTIVHIKITGLGISWGQTTAQRELTSSDIVVSGGCIETIVWKSNSDSNNNTIWRLEIHLLSEIKENLIITILENSVSGGNSTVSKRFEVNTISSVTTTSSIPAALIGDGVFIPDDPLSNSTIVFYIYWANVTLTQVQTFVTGINGNIHVKRVSDNARLDQLVNFSKSAPTPTGNTVKLTISNLTANRNDYLYITIPANAISHSGFLSVDSSPVEYNTQTGVLTVPPSATFAIPTGIQRGTTSDIQINFGERIIGLTDGDFIIIGPSSTPSKILLAQDFEIELATATATKPSTSTITFPSITPTLRVTSIIRSPAPRRPAASATKYWILHLDRPLSNLINSQISGITLASGTNPVFIDDNYILRITNPSNSSGTINATLSQNTVRTVDDSTLGPINPQSSGSFGFNTKGKVVFTIGEAYTSSTATATTGFDRPTGGIITDDVYIEIQANSAVTDFDRSDIIPIGICADAGPLNPVLYIKNGNGPIIPTPANTAWRLHIDPRENSSGSFTIFIPQNIVINGNDQTEKLFTYNTGSEITPSGLIGTWRYANFSEFNKKIYAGISFNKEITGLDITSTSNDIEIRNADTDINTGLSGWTFVFSGTKTDNPNTLPVYNPSTQTGVLGIIVTPPPNSNLNVQLVFKEDSIRFGSSSDDGPSSSIISEPIPVNTLSSGVTSTDLVGVWRYANFSQFNKKIYAGISFNKEITGLDITSTSNDIEVRNADTNSVESGWTFVFSGTKTDNPNTLPSYDPSINQGVLGIIVTPPPNSNLNVQLVFKRDSIQFGSPSDDGPSNNIISPPIPVNTLSSGVTSTDLVGIWRYANFSQFNKKIYAGISFNKEITGLDITSTSNDIEVRNADTNSVESGWTFVFSGTKTDNPNTLPSYDPSINQGVLGIIVTPPPNSNLNVQLVFKRDSIQFGSPSDDGPSNNIISPPIPVNTLSSGVTSTDLVGTWRYANFSEFNKKIYAGISFNKEITGLNITDIGIRNADTNTEVSELSRWTFIFAGTENSGTTLPVYNPSMQTGVLGITITPPPEENLNVQLVFKRDSIQFGSPSDDGPSSNIISQPISVNTVTESITSELIGTWRYANFSEFNKKIYAGISFNKEITGLNITDIGIRNADTNTEVSELSRWTFIFAGTENSGTTLPVYNPSMQTGVLGITITPPPEENLNVQLVFKRDSIQFGSPSDDGPSSNIISQPIPVNTVTESITSEVIGIWQYANYCKESNEILTAIQFNKKITGLNVTNNHNIEIQSATRNIISDPGWSLSFSGHTGSGSTVSLEADTNLVITVTPPDNINQNVYLVFKAGTITFNTSSTGPLCDIVSESIPVDNRTLVTFNIGEAYASKDFTNESELSTPLSSSTVYIQITTENDRAIQEAADLIAADFIVSGGYSAYILQMDSNNVGKKWRLEINLPTDTKGILTIAIPNNVIREGNNPISKSFSFDPSASQLPSATFHVPEEVQIGKTTDIKVDFGQRVFGLMRSSFTIKGYTPPPQKVLLAQDFLIRLDRARNSLEPDQIEIETSESNVPFVISVIRSPLESTTGSIKGWIIRLNRPVESLSPGEVFIDGTVLGRGVPLLFIDESYILRITNPPNDSGSLYAVLEENSVSVQSPAGYLRGPAFDQESDPYIFETFYKAAFVEKVDIPSGKLNSPFNVELKFNRPVSKLFLGSFTFDGINLELPDLYYYPINNYERVGKEDPWKLLSSFKIHEIDPRGIAQQNDDFYFIGNSRKAFCELSFSDSGSLENVLIQNENMRIFDLDEIDPRGLVSHENNFYMVDAITKALYAITKNTGAASQVGSQENFNLDGEIIDPRGLASNGLASDDALLYMICQVNTSFGLYIVSTSTSNAGLASPVDSPLPQNFGLNQPEIDPWGLAYYKGQLYTLDNENKLLYQINSNTGIATRIGNSTKIQLPSASGLSGVNDKLYLLSSEYKGSLYELELSEDGLSITQILRIQEKIGADSESRDFQLRFGKPQDDAEGTLNIMLKANTVE